MQPKIYIAVTGAMAVFSLLQSNAQTNKSLSNLTAPTAINQSLLPATDGQDPETAKDLGSIAKSWGSLFISGRLYLDDSIAMHARGTGNFFSGISAGNIIYKGDYNTGIGWHALRNLVSGGQNTALGYGALYKNGSGSNNAGSGYNALYNNTTGRDNAAHGYISLYNNATGSYNTGSGSWALYSNASGNHNTAYGYSALWQNRSGNDNTAVGKYTLYSNTTGYSNVAIGTGALYKNASGFRLVAIGDSALYNFSGPHYYGGANTAVGSKALYKTTTGTVNTAFGSDALRDNVSGSYNTATGRGALLANSSGSYNTAVGFNALLWSQSGSYNTSVGAYAGGQTLFHETTNSTSIGYYADAYKSNQVRIGNTSVTSIGGQVGWTIFSDGRYKKDIKEDVSGLAFINSLRPVTYKVEVARLNAHFTKGMTSGMSKRDDAGNELLNKAAEKASAIVHTGFVAQEVEEAAKKINYAFDGVDKPEKEDGLYGLRYDGFVAPLVKAVQELSKQNDQKDSIIASLEERLLRLEKAVANPVSHSTNVSAASLGQNTPNPFNNTTVISYTLPQTFTTAQLVITDKNGKTIKQIRVSGAGSGAAHVDASSLAAGAYHYSLVIDGKLIGTRQMVLAK